MLAALTSISFVDDVFDHDGKFVSFAPISVPLHATIGTKDCEGGDLFIFKACNVAWIINEISNSPSLINKTIICDNRSLHELEKHLREVVSKIQGLNWEEITFKLEKLSYWEFAK